MDTPTEVLAKALQAEAERLAAVKGAPVPGTPKHWLMLASNLINHLGAAGYAITRTRATRPSFYDWAHENPDDPDDHDPRYDAW